VETLWLGYDGLELPFSDVVAVLLYHTALDGNIMRAYGTVPLGVRAVVVTTQGQYFPARWAAAQLRGRWARWRLRQGYVYDDDRDRGSNGDAGDAN
jgi:hypothetical protein